MAAGRANHISSMQQHQLDEITTTAQGYRWHGVGWGGLGWGTERNIMETKEKDRLWGNGGRGGCYIVMLSVAKID